MRDIIIDTFEATKQRLATAGWCKDKQGGENGPNCVTGALLYVVCEARGVQLASTKHVAACLGEHEAFYRDLLTRLRNSVHEWSGGFISKYETLSCFNDKRETELQDVNAVLDLAIKHRQTELQA